MYINKVVEWTNAGYGNLAPKTGPGKVVTIIYALIGKNFVLFLNGARFFQRSDSIGQIRRGP